MQSVYDLVEEARKKCGKRFSPIEYALSRSKQAQDEASADLWQKAAEVLRQWQKPH